MGLKRDEEVRKMGLIPLIDVVFLLLIFFIIATVIGKGLGKKPPTPSFPSDKEGFLPAGGDGPEKLPPPFPTVEHSSSPSLATLTIRLKRTQEGNIEMYLFDSNVPDLDSLNRLIENDLNSGQELQQRYGPFQTESNELPENLRGMLRGRVVSAKAWMEESGRSFSLQIKADEDTPYGLVIDVFATCREQEVGVEVADIWVKKELKRESGFLP